MEFRLLGPLEVRRSGPLVAVGGPRQQLVLAALLFRANETATVPHLVESVWERPPASPETNLRTYVAGLRQRLGTTRLATVTGGYRLEVHPGELDVTSFGEHVAHARAARARGDLADAADAFDRALSMWRGEPLEGCRPGPALRTELDGLSEQRLRVFVEHTQCRLDLGQHHAVLDELRQLVARYPLREDLWAQLMLALHRSGRRADALDAYLRAGRHLAEDAGIDPGQALRDTHAAILRDDPGLAAGAVEVSEPVPPRPAQLPADTRTFAGRAAEVARLLETAAGSGGGGVVGVIDGMAGVGKTALAVHVAHRLAGQFPDGQVFVDLHGYTEGMSPTKPAAALAAVLRALGVPGREIPGGLDERAGLYRTWVAGRRVLIVLDNVNCERQVVPLLPGSAGSVLLVTSRRRLVGLDGAVSLSLDVLALPDAVRLFTDAAGPGRIRAGDRPVAEQVVQWCGRLPLAVCIAAARLRHRPALSLAGLAEVLGDERDRLSELRAGHRSVGAAFHLSYASLTLDQQRTFCRLGLHPGSDIDASAAAALTGASVRSARRSLDDLLEAHLLVQRTEGRYQFHDLLRAHAAALARTVDGESDRHAAVGRLLDYYARASSAAMDLVYPGDPHLRPRTAPAATPDASFADPPAAETWLDAELRNLLAAAQYAANHDRPDHTVHQSSTLYRHLGIRGHYADAAKLHHDALRAARGSGDRAAEADILSRLGSVHRVQGDPDRAAGHFNEALNLARATGYSIGERTALIGLGEVHYIHGRYQPAITCYEQALHIAGEDPQGQLDVLTGLGRVHQLQGRHDQAASCYQRMLDIARGTANSAGEVNALTGLGHIHYLFGQYELADDYFTQSANRARSTGNRLGELYALVGKGTVALERGHHAAAADTFHHALTVSRDTGNRHGELNALTGLGRAHRLQGRCEPAAHAYEHALHIGETIGDRNGQFESYDGLGRTYLATGDHDGALTCHRTALALASDLGQPADQARAHDGLAHTYHALDNHSQARQHWTAALDILTGHGIDHTEDPQVSITSVGVRLDSRSEPRGGGATG